MTTSRLAHLFLCAIALLAFGSAPAACSKGCGPSAEELQALPAPPVPQEWTVEQDTIVAKDTREFLDAEGRLKGRLEALRIITFQVNGRRVQLNVMKPANAAEGDKMFRILANRKTPWSYARKGEVMYEFLGPAEAIEDIRKAREMIGD